MEKVIIKQSMNAMNYIKQGYVLYMLETKTIVYKENEKIILYHEKWHSKMSEADFVETFENNTFQLIEDRKEVEISKEKDDEYYQWRALHQ